MKRVSRRCMRPAIGSNRQLPHKHCCCCRRRQQTETRRLLKEQRREVDEERELKGVMTIKTGKSVRSRKEQPRAPPKPKGNQHGQVTRYAQG